MRHRKKTTLASLIGAAALLVSGTLAAVFAAPASADEPGEPPPNTVTFSDVNPCSGELHELTLTFTYRGHRHTNGGLLIGVVTGSTDDGFVLEKGHDIQRINFISDIGSRTLVNNWVNPETGERFRAQLVFVGVFPDGPPPAPPSEVKVDRFSRTCVGGPTILP